MGQLLKSKAIWQYLTVFRWQFLMRLSAAFILFGAGYWGARNGLGGMALLAFLGGLLAIYLSGSALWLANKLDQEPDYVELYKMSGLNPDDSFVIVDVGFRNAGNQLHRLLRRGKLTVIDIYNPQIMPDPSLTRYRLHAQPALSDPRLRWVDGDLDLLALPDNGVEAIIVPRIFWHMNQKGDQVRLLKAAQRALAPGGKLLVSEWVLTPRSILIFLLGALGMPAYSHWQTRFSEAGFNLKMARLHCQFIGCYRAEKKMFSEGQQLTFAFEEEAPN